MIVAGIGCGRDTAAAEIVALIDVALKQFDIARDDLAALATESAKADEPCLIAAAHQLALPLLRCSVAELDAVEERLLTRSERVRALKGTASIAEAAALVGAGRDATLLGPRITSGRITCAIARGSDT
ncbi:MAG: cobalamin biosynthesis protein [Tardiphaga sp.]